MRNFPSGTVTFVFTDLEGSTRLLYELGDAYAQALAEHRRIIRETFVRNGGVEVDTQGDAFFYAFPRASDGVAAAQAAQQVLASGPVRTRMGLHTGEPQLTNEGYVGLDVHVGARIAACGHGGQVLLSEATRRLVDSAVRDLGEHRLKDLPTRLRLFQLGDDDFPPLKSLSQTNLPTPATPFLGRTREFVELVELLRNAQVRLLTLTGPAGSGKTRLALEVASELVGDYEHGVWWVPLAPLRDAELVHESVVQTLGATDELAKHVGDRAMLLLLDNFEHVVKAASGLAELLARCPKLNVLVTSRERLHLMAEREYAVPPLAEEDAVGLFRDRAAVAEPEEAVREICRRLDCLPLAVELAAVRTKALPPTQLLERLEKRLPLLTGGPHDAPERQRTLHAAIEWSYELLAEKERRLFACLAIFVGGCTLEAAEDVAEADIDTVQSLVEKSLVRRSGERFSMLETIREYALERLAQSHESEELARCHAEYFLGLGERKDVTTTVESRPRALDELAPERDNFRAATAWAIEGGRSELALRLVTVGGWYTVPTREWDSLFVRALSIAENVPPRQRVAALLRATYAAKEVAALGRARRLYEELIDLARELRDIRVEALAFGGMGDVLTLEGEYSAARQLYEKEIALLEQAGLPQDVKYVLQALGEVEMRAGGLDRAERLLQESISRGRSERDPRLVAKALHSLGDVHLRSGRLREAERAYAESLRTGRPFRDPRYAVYSLAGIAAVASLDGNVPRAGRLWGAVEGIEEREQVRVADGDRLHYELHIAGARPLPEFADGFEVGRAWSLDEALDFVVASPD